MRLLVKIGLNGERILLRRCSLGVESTQYWNEYSYFRHLLRRDKAIICPVDELRGRMRFHIQIINFMFKHTFLHKED